MEDNNKTEEHEIQPPVGDFILEQTDIKPQMTQNGAYYHYSDVCTLLKRYDKSNHTSKEKTSNELYVAKILWNSGEKIEAIRKVKDLFPKFSLLETKLYCEKNF